MPAILLLVICGLRLVWIEPAPAVSNRGATLSGTATDSLSGEFLPSISIALYHRASTRPLRVGVTNKFGFYSIPNIPLGNYSVVVRVMGYAEFRRAVTIDEQDASPRIDVQLVQEAIGMQEVIVEAERVNETTTPINALPVRTEFLRRLPSISGEPDLLRALQLLPGVKGESEFSGGLYVRGSSPDQNLTLLDGMPVFNPTHLGGLLSTFNSDALSDVQLTKGGFPAEFGGRSASVLDIAQRNGTRERLSGSAGLSLLSARVMFEGPLADNSSFMISGRRMYADLLVPLFADERTTPTYYFYDLNGKASFELSPFDRLVVSAYGGRDAVNSRAVTDELNFDIAWRNSAAGIRWLHILSPNLFTNISLVYSGYDFSTRVETEPIAGDQTFNSSSKISDITLRGDLQWFAHEDHTMKFGIEATSNFYDATAEEKIANRLQSAIESAPSRVFNLATYLQDEWNITRSLKAHVGARMSRFGNGEFTTIEPRVAAEFAFNDVLRVKSSFAIAHQYLHLVIRNDITFPTDLWLRSSGTVVPARTTQATFGFEADLFEKEFRFGIEGYYKSMRNLYEYKETADFTIGVPTADNFTEGVGAAYGLEVLFEKRIGKLTGWLGYTLAWTTRTFAEVNNGNTFYPRYDRRHDASLVLAYKLNERWEFGTTWMYATGQPYTLPVGKFNFRYFSGYERYYYDFIERNGYRFPAFHKLDVNATHSFSWFGLPFKLSLNIYNVYDRRNAFVRYIAHKKQSTPYESTRPALFQLTLFPILPSIGLSCAF